MRKMIRVANPEPFVAKDDDDMIICRCEEITKVRFGKPFMTACEPPTK